MPITSEGQEAPRPVGSALARGLRRRCPACGEGRLLRGYSTVNDRCSRCGEELFHHRADDFPQYLTIFVVGHVLVAALLVVDDLWPDLPVSLHYVIWPSLVLALSLVALPVFKGMLIAYQWALRMHGFETAHATPDAASGAAQSGPPADGVHGAGEVPARISRSAA